jgi:predicted metal-binding protein
MHQIQTNSMVIKLDQIDVQTLILCKTCISRKQHRDKFPIEGGTKNN